jgi:hypothetical protein
LAGIPVEPIFIHGLHRSGTTLLCSLMQATQRFNVVTTYHVLRFRQILARHLAGETEWAKAELAVQFRAVGVLDRVIDGVRVTPDMPEEYGFVSDRASERCGIGRIPTPFSLSTGQTFGKGDIIRGKAGPPRS